MRPHLSLNVRNLKNSVKFYKSVFGLAPQKQTKTYAKFDLKKPAFNFSMHESAAGRLPSRVNHLGIEVMAPKEVDAWIKKLKKLGVATIEEEDSTCCFARQDKVWFQDPDGNSWEIFFVHEQLPTLGAEPPAAKKKTAKGVKAAACAPASGCC